MTTLVWLLIRSPHWVRRHLPWLHLVHLGSWRARLHVHHVWLLMVALLRPLMAHHWSAWPWAREPISAGSRHVARILWICRSWSWRVHLHLRVAWHSHKRPVRGLVRHHLTSHCRPRGTNKLPPLYVSHRNMLDIGTHAILRHLHRLRIAGHLLGLCSIYKRCARSW